MNTRDMKTILFALSATLVAACATTAPEPPPSRVQVQEEVGFTITEEARIGGDVRADYETALSYLQQGRHDEGIALLERVAAAAPELSTARAISKLRRRTCCSRWSRIRSSPSRITSSVLSTARPVASTKPARVTSPRSPFTRDSISRAATWRFSATSISRTSSAHCRTTRRT